MNIVGIDFGHGEVSASYISGNDNVKQLKLVNTVENVVDEWKIPSYMYQYKDPNSGVFAYCLDKPRVAHSLISEMKKPISYMDDEEKEHYKAFIQLIVQRLKECNSELQDDFELAIACPTKWLEYQKEEYKQFFNEALSDFGIEIYAIMNESDAAFFAKYRKNDHDKNILVVDYGSSTIDFTLVSKGKKVELDDVSSSNLGASAIEKAVLATYATDKNSNYAPVHQTVDPVLKRNNLEWIDMNKFILAQIRKKKETMYTARELYIDRFDYIPWHCTGLLELRRSDLRFNYELIDPLMEVQTIKEYVEKVEEILLGLKKRAEQEGHHIDKVIMSGGACMMKWIQESIAKIFDTENIELDRYPAFVVCDGIVKYCQKYQECINKLIAEIDNINFEKILQESDIDTINAISEDDIKGAIRSWRCDSSMPSIADLIYQRIPNLYINNFNPTNSKFNDKYNTLMTSKVKSRIEQLINKIIKDVFGINVKVDSFSYQYTDGAKYSYSEKHRDQIYYYLRNYFENRNRYWSFTSFLGGFYDINYFKDRSGYEREEIANNLLSNFSSIFHNFDSKAGFSYPQMSNDVIDWYKAIVYNFALKLMEEKQLFKTSFSK